MILIIRKSATPEQMEQMLEELKFYIKLAVEARSPYFSRRGRSGMRTALRFCCILNWENIWSDNAALNQVAHEANSWSQRV
ncbi:MAG: hypothetical protein SAK29_20950 [Scytonema sp. PMC 1069.18]|nr:hypothetical protein [Scytonema sp. PMC 1069.18]MEC4886712.1 hypothetical protein [Scytonema sp. PMC 1070.18]